MSKSYCSDEFENTIAMATGQEVTKTAVKLIIAILGAAAISIIFPGLGTAIGLTFAKYFSGFFGNLAVSVILSGIVKPYLKTYMPCVRYCRGNYKS